MKIKYLLLALLSSLSFAQKAPDWTQDMKNAMFEEERIKPLSEAVRTSKLLMENGSANYL